MDDRGNKNDINLNTHSSMNPLMQNAKMCTVLFSNPNQNITVCSLTLIKERPKKEERHQNNTVVISLYSMAVQWWGAH